VTHAFIVRPFGEKGGIDFDQVEALLIDPVLTALGIKGRTTAEIFEAGNIRTDMFEALLVADIVIADISIYNANVYYELGIRHALRDRVTIMIRAGEEKVPFDLSTDRYLAYDSKDPTAARDQLRAAIKDSLAGTTRDSPVFMLLPKLRAHDPEDFRPVPEGFSEEVRIARDRRDLPKLAVLGDEADEARWQVGGLRLVGQAQFDLKAWQDAKATYGEIVRERPHDPDANLKLGTVLQRLGDLPESSAVLDRVLKQEGLPTRDYAEASALVGRNAKARWRTEWMGKAPADRSAAALRSGFIETAYAAYDRGFLWDQNHWYPGINALALLTIRLELAKLEPDVWEEGFKDAAAATTALGELAAEHALLTAAVLRSLRASRLQAPEEDPWRDFTEAEVTLVTAEKPTLAARAYREANAKATASFQTQSAADQLQLYLDVGVLKANAEAALAALELDPEPAVTAEHTRTRTLVFSGHRIDAPGREHPRFPPAAEAHATAMIRQAIEKEKALAGDNPIVGIAGGASGGDIIFHEQCAALGIPTELLLALPHEQFCTASVAEAGSDWVDRYRRLWQRVTTRVLAETEELPRWLGQRDDYSIWQRNNRWILHSATSRADTDVTLIVLWDGKGGDGPGGTEDMVRLGRSRGVRFVRLDANELLV
jgi:hypothetical protein